MNCPKCGSDDGFVRESRTRNSNRYRRRQCNVCGYRFSTLEILVKDYKEAAYLLGNEHRALHMEDSKKKGVKP